MKIRKLILSALLIILMSMLMTSCKEVNDLGGGTENEKIQFYAERRSTRILKEDLLILPLLPKKFWMP